MLTLLAESKTMDMNQTPLTESDYMSHKPVFEEEADAIMGHIEDMSLNEITEKMGVSRQLAGKVHELAYNFPHKLTGIKALQAFIGDAYRGFDVKTLSEEAQERANTGLRIVSSVYGSLKPDDIIKPYRCEFNKPVCSGEKTPIQVYKPKMTIEMVKFIQQNKITDIIDLLPGDADKCLDWKIIRAYARVHKICFQTIGEDGKLKTPIAKRLKELRGKMARQIFMDNINSFADLTKVESQDYIFSTGDSKPGLPIFICG